MSELFKGFEQLLELAKTLEEKAQSGEIQTDVRVNTRPLSNIPRSGNIPHSAGGNSTRRSTPTNFATHPEPEVVYADDRSSAGNRTASPTQPTPSDSPADGISPSLQEIGGLQAILQELKELIGIPLKRPELLKNLGLEPPKGVLLVGPPGTGKTLTARALATELGVNYMAIVGPEIMGKFYGEAEGRLRSIFEKAARSTPCLIFIDELDSLAPDRAKVEGEVEKRVVAQLLSLMDGFAQTTGVIVLAATNRPNHLDPALRRPGRFDREIQFRVPDRQGREEILHILTQAMPLQGVDLATIADQSVGFVGADLKALCQKAAYIALRRAVPGLDAPTPDQMSILATDFAQALRDIKPSVLRSVEVETPEVTWAEIGGLNEIKRILQDSVEGALRYPDLYQHTGARAPRGILLWGPPGTGKTLLAKAVATQARANFIGINGPELLSRWVGASEQAVRELFTKARQASPCVVFLDELDTLVPVRGRYGGDSGVSDRVVGQLLTELDGLQSCANLLVIGATNRPEAIDPALLRSGRLELQLKVDLPDVASRFAILQVHNGDRPLHAVDLAFWAQETEGWNGADLALLSNQAALEAVRHYRNQNRSNPSNLYITTENFEQAYQALLLQR